MTYTLFECLKDRLAEVMEGQPQPGSGDEESADGSESDDDDDDDSDSSDADIGNLSIAGSSKAPKKEKLTKAQKRRQWDQAMTGGERPRGWNWVDIVKHLSQCGKGDEVGSTPQHYDG